MTNTLTDNHDVYCYLKQLLEPAYSVIAEPQPGYYAQWKYCYRILDGKQQLAELTGDFRELTPGGLVYQAQTLIQQLSNTASNSVRSPERPASLQIASRLPPRRDVRTWFSSGRAAFTWLVRDVVKPRRVYLPTFICWSLVDVMLQRFPDTQLEFYAVDRHLNCTYPTELMVDDAVVDVHYFGHHSEYAANCGTETVLEDCSHCFLQATEDENHNAELKDTRPGHESRYRFGSLRKAYRVADGGFLQGTFSPSYQADPHLEAWLRLAAVDWKDLREAENMTDRQFRISDISSQSLAVILSTNVKKAAEQKRANNVFLNNNFDCGTALVNFKDEEVPLLHVRHFDCAKERNSLVDYLAAQQVFTSIHWPVHEHLLQQQGSIDTEGALWMENHTFAIPIAEDFGNEQMETICGVAADWKRAGGARFPHLAAG